MLVVKGRALQREPFSIAISARFHFAQYRMLLWQIMVNHVMRINFIPFPLINPIRFVYYICGKTEMISTNYIFLCFGDHQINGYHFHYLYHYIVYHHQPNQSFGS
jgi:hypothetical protein